MRNKPLTTKQKRTLQEMEYWNYISCISPFYPYRSEYKACEQLKKAGLIEGDFLAGFWIKEQK